MGGAGMHTTQAGPRGRGADPARSPTTSFAGVSRGGRIIRGPIAWLAAGASPGVGICQSLFKRNQPDAPD